MQASYWLSVSALCVIGCLLIVVLVWVGRSELRQRRKARAAREVAAAYRKERASDTGANKEVTVAELVERTEAEGLPVRLNWAEGHRDTSGEEWPTGVMPRQ